MTLLVSNSRSFPCNLSERHKFFISISVPWFLVFLQLGCRSIKIQSKSTTNDRQPGDGCLEPYSLNYASFGVGWIRNGREIMQGVGSSQSNLSFRSNIYAGLLKPIRFLNKRLFHIWRTNRCIGNKHLLRSIAIFILIRLLPPLYFNWRLFFEITDCRQQMGESRTIGLLRSSRDFPCYRIFECNGRLKLSCRWWKGWWISG